MGLAITGTGSALPSRVVTNHDLERSSVDWDSERAGSSLHDWVLGRIGIRQRHRVGEGETTATMATDACRAALASADVAPDEVDLLVLSTFTSDHRLPQSASLVAGALGLHRAKVLQLDAACGGFLDGCVTAAGVMPLLGARTALVVHAECVSSVLDDQRFLMQSIFADGAGAVVLQDDPDRSGGLLGLHTATEVDGPKLDWLWCGGGCASPITAEVLEDRSHCLTIDHRSIFDFAVDRMARAVLMSLDAAGRDLDEVDWVIAHQTGINIIHAVADRLGVERMRFLLAIEETGNTSGATIPIALDRHHRAGAFRPGDLLVLPAVGAGMVWGALAVEWVAIDQPVVLADADDDLLSVVDGEGVAVVAT